MSDSPQTVEYAGNSLVVETADAFWQRYARGLLFFHIIFVALILTLILASLGLTDASSSGQPLLSGWPRFCYRWENENYLPWVALCYGIAGLFVWYRVEKVRQPDSTLPVSYMMIGILLALFDISIQITLVAVSPITLMAGPIVRGGVSYISSLSRFLVPIECTLPTWIILSLFIVYRCKSFLRKPRRV